MPAHLLTCPECNANVAVEEREAGSNVQCAKGHSIAVPKLRELRGLPLAPNAGPKPPEESQWTKKHGLIFVGFLLFLAGAIPAAYWMSKMPTLADIGADHEKLDLVFKDVTPNNAWVLWVNEILPNGIQLPVSRLEEAVRHEIDRQRTMIGMALTVSMVGILLQLAGFFWRPGKPPIEKHRG